MHLKDIPKADGGDRLYVNIINNKFNLRLLIIQYVPTTFGKSHQ